MWILLLQTFLLMLTAFLAGAVLACLYKRTIDSIVTRPYPNEFTFVAAERGLPGSRGGEIVSARHTSRHSGTMEPSNIPRTTTIKLDELRILETAVLFRRRALWSFWLGVLSIFGLVVLAWTCRWFPDFGI